MTQSNHSMLKQEMDIFQQICLIKENHRSLFFNNRQCPTQAVFLRPVQATSADATLLSEWRSKHYQAFFSWIRPDENEMLAWLKAYARDDKQIIFIIEDRKGTSIGQVSLYQINKEKRCAEFGRIIKASPRAPTGSMYNGLMLLLTWAFNRLKLGNIHLEVFADNQQALALYKDLGFQITEKTLYVPVTANDSFVRWTNIADITLSEKRLQSQREVYRMAFRHKIFTSDICPESAYIEEATHE